jgi:DHA2 family multidrug resistance protein
LAQGAAEQPLVNPWIIALTVMLATFMEVLDTSVANVALPHIAGSLSQGIDETTWVLTSYLVSNAIVLPMSGWFSSLFGRKRFYMLCVFLFTLSSFLCGMAPSLTLLVIFRVMQGLGGGALQPISQAILVESFPKHKQGMAMAIYGMGVVLAPIIGPTLGGWITDNYSWRWIFFINIPVGAFSILMSSMLLHDPPYLVRKKLGSGVKIDYIGLGLLSVGVGFLEVVIDEGQREDWFSSNLIVASAIVAVICLTLVVFWELRQKEPVVELHLLKERNYAMATFIMFMVGFVLYGSTVLLPIFLQTLMGYTAMLSGLVLSPGGLLVLVVMPLVGYLVSRFEARWLVLLGLFFCSLGMFYMSWFNLNIDYRTAVVARMIQSLGMAFLFVPINAVAFNFIPREKTGYATGLINLARNIGGSSGIAFVITMLARRSQFHQNILVSHMTPYNSNYQAMLQGSSQFLLSQGATAPQAQAQGLLYGMLQRQSAMLAFVDAFWLLAVLFIALVPLIFLMKKTQPHRLEMAGH